MKSRLIFPGYSLETLRRALLVSAPSESAAVVLAGRATTNAREMLLAREIHEVSADGYLAQEPLRAVVKPEFIAPLLKRARNEHWSLFLVHTHPFSEGPPAFSVVDNRGENQLMPAIFARVPDGPHGSLVLSRTGATARSWESVTSGSSPMEMVIECGPKLRLYSRDQQPLDSGTEFDRNIRAFGADGQRSLQRLVFAVVGVGGTGSIVVEQLAHLGARDLLLLDFDRLEETNLNRVVGAQRRNVGEYKVNSARDLACRIREDINCESIVGNVLNRTDARRLLDADFIFCCTDSHGSRHVLNQIAYQFMKPVIDVGVTIDARDKHAARVSGRVQLLAPGMPCLTCQNLLDPEQVRRDLLSDEERAKDPYILGTHEPQPAVISLNGTMASMAVTMMLATVASFPSGPRHQVFLGDRGVVRAVDSRSEENCVVCSKQGALGRGDNWPMPGRVA
jgi:molybdopterin/thiamine biosynthesis adenylyltransferase